MARDGEVIMVHFHPDDPEEAVLLKKALASTLSAKVKVKLFMFYTLHRLYILTSYLYFENFEVSNGICVCCIFVVVVE